MCKNKDYPLISATRNCARFVYGDEPRVVRVISINGGNVTGYETRKGEKIVNKRFAKIKSFKITRMKGGKLVLSNR